jgi:outer membrane protein assembly factor BamB
LLLSCDSETGSFFLAVDKDTGKLKWRVERPEFTRGFSTPVVYQPPSGGAEVLVAGSGQLTAYSVETGEAVWWVHGLTWQLKPTPVIGDGVIYVLGWAGGADTGQQDNIPSFAEVLKQYDSNKDAKLAKEELPDPRLNAAFTEGDLDRDGFLGERDWKMFQVRRSSQNAIMAVRLGGRGDMTDKNIIWRYYKSLPNAPSPLLYRGVVYLMKEGGILTTLDAKTGNVLKQGRLNGALDQYFSSPVAADGKVYVVSQSGHTSVLKAGGEWEHLAVNDMDEECFATPALVDGRIYLRTHSALYCFGKPGAAKSQL